MANLRKFQTMKDIGHLCKHYERSVEKGHYSNTNIDQDKLSEDKTNLAPDRGKQTEYIKEKIKEISNGKTMRKDAVRMCCWIIDLPKELPKEKSDVFFKTAYDFLVDRYGTKSGLGEDVVISCYVHKSEETEHLHFAFLPVIEKDGQKKFCRKELISRNDLKTFHEDLAKVMEEKGICKKSDILNGSTQKDSSGRAISVKELKKQRALEQERRSKRWDISEDIRNQERTIDRW